MQCSTRLSSAISGSSDAVQCGLLICTSGFPMSGQRIIVRSIGVTKQEAEGQTA